MKRFVAVVALVLCAATLVSVASAQDASTRIKPNMILNVPAAIERTPQQMDAFDATANIPTGGEVLFRPTNPAQYAAMKHPVNMAAPGVTRPNTNTSSPAPLASVAATFTGGTECDGDTHSFGCWQPPDVAGSIGKTQFVSVHNNMFEVRNRSGVLVAAPKSLNTVCKYTKEAMFDPRVQYDEEFQRWVITADAFPESGTKQVFCIAVSKTSSASGAYWVYLVNVMFGANDFYDYPMLGMSQDALLMTANIFTGCTPNCTGFQGSSLFSVSKARVYNGFGFSVPVFLGLNATLEPAHQVVTDQNPYAWLAAWTGSGSITMYNYKDPANAFSASLSAPIAVANVPAGNGPPGAPQPAACAPAGALLDSLDGRFQNAGTQVGDTYYQVHDENLVGFPTPRYYIITGLSSFAPTVSVSNQVYASGTSNDFNPSIASDVNGHFGLNWSVTDSSLNASVHFADNNGGNPSGISGVNVFTSASCYTGVGTSRWGDYSQVSLDPGTGTVSNLASGVYWIDNETIPSANFWSTEIAAVNY